MSFDESSTTYPKGDRMNLTHPHGLDTLSGYSVVLADWSTGETLERIEIARIDGANGYGRALEIRDEMNRHASSAQNALVDNLYTCGCRSHERLAGLPCSSAPRRRRSSAISAR